MKGFFINLLMFNIGKNKHKNDVFLLKNKRKIYLKK